MGLSDGDLERLRRVLGDDTFAGRFAIEAEAGSGGMGIVYRAIEQASGRAVAIKVLTDDTELDHARFALEAEVLERMAHPAIVAYAGHGVTTTGRPYLAMAWLDGESLSHRLKRGMLSIAEAVTIGARVASALAHAHAQDVVHRDVKPSNVMLVGGAPEQATLIDFGVAKDINLSKGLTFTGQIVGTPSYMAPEQAIGNTKLDGRVDLFALGCLLYECLTGAPPFEGGELLEILAKLLLHDPPRLREKRPDVPPRLDALVASLLAKEPEQRIADAATAARELELVETAIADGDEATLAVPTLGTRRPVDPEAATIAIRPVMLARPPAARRWPIVTAGLVIAVVIVVAVAMVPGSPAHVVVDAGAVALRADAGTEGPPRDATATDAAVASCRRGDAECRSRCTAGEAKACAELGHATYQGSQIEADQKDGITLMKRACELDDPVACMQAGNALYKWPRTSPAFAKTAWQDAFERGCKLGNASACSVFATRLLHDTQETARAEQLFERSCALRNIGACIQAAKLLDAIPDPTNATRMYKAACALGHHGACERVDHDAHAPVSPDARSHPP